MTPRAASALAVALTVYSAAAQYGYSATATPTVQRTDIAPGGYWWTLGAPGAACTAVCASQGAACDVYVAGRAPWPNSDADMLSIAASIGVSCTGVAQDVCGFSQGACATAGS